MTNVELPIRASERARRARIERALALLDTGEVASARAELRAALEAAEVEIEAPATSRDEASPTLSAHSLASSARSVPSPAEPARPFSRVLADDEIDLAFTFAETNTDEMMSANKVVEETLAASGLAEPDPDAPFDVTERPTYATRSMAALLEGQGRKAEARKVRASLVVEDARVPSAVVAPLPSALDLRLPSAVDAAAAGFLGEADADRLRILATLEGWLHNVRRGIARDSMHEEGTREPRERGMA